MAYLICWVGTEGKIERGVQERDTVTVMEEFKKRLIKLNCYKRANGDLCKTALYLALEGLVILGMVYLVAFVLLPYMHSSLSETNAFEFYLYTYAQFLGIGALISGGLYYTGTLTLILALILEENNGDTDEDSKDSDK